MKRAKLRQRTLAGGERTLKQVPGRAPLPLVLAETPDDLLVGGDEAHWATSLTIGERKLLLLIARGYAPVHAGQLAGFGELGALKLQVLLGKRAGYAYLRRAQQLVLTGELTGLAFSALGHILQDAEAPAPARVAAARTVMEGAGLLGRRAEETAAMMRAEGIDTAFLSATELADLAAQTKAEIAQLREIVDAAERRTVEGSAEELPG